MAVAHVGTLSQASQNGGTISATVSGAIAGNTLVCTLGANAAISFADTTGNWTLILRENPFETIEVWVRVASGDANDNINFTGGSSWMNHTVDEYSGIAVPHVQNGTPVTNDGYGGEITLNFSTADADPSGAFTHFLCSGGNLIATAPENITVSNSFNIDSQQFPAWSGFQNAIHTASRSVSAAGALPSTWGGDATTNNGGLEAGAFALKEAEEGPPPGTPEPLVFVTQHIATFTNATGATGTVSGAIPGNVLIWAMATRGPTRQPITDNTGNWTKALEVSGAGGINAHTLWYRVASGDSNDNIDFTCSSDSLTIQYVVNEYSGLAVPVVLTGTPSQTATNSNPVAGISHTHTPADADPAAIFSVFGVNGTGSWSTSFENMLVSNGFVKDGQPAIEWGADWTQTWPSATVLASLEVASADPVTADWTGDGSASYIQWQGVSGLGLKLAVTPGPGPGPDPIDNISGVPFANIAAINGVPIANISAINGVSL